MAGNQFGRNGMTATRRSALIGAASAGALAACRPGAPKPPGDVIAAGQPAALLIWAVARERLAGWPHKPSPKALNALPDSAAELA